MTDVQQMQHQFFLKWLGKFTGIFKGQFTDTALLFYLFITIFKHINLSIMPRTHSMAVV